MHIDDGHHSKDEISGEKHVSEGSLKAFHLIKIASPLRGTLKGGQELTRMRNSAVLPLYMRCS